MPEDFRNIQEGLSTYVKIGTVIFLTLAGGFLFFVTHSISKKRKLLLAQKELEFQHTQSLLQTHIEIQEQTLKTISQEIHDNVGQVLSLAKLNLNTLEFDTGVSKEEKISKSIQLVSKAINDLRDLSRSLNGDKVADLGLNDAIDNELKIIENTGQFNTGLFIEGTSYKLQPQNEMVVFRIVQESLNNALKYSKAKNINVYLKYLPQLFSIIISDDGIGFDATKLEALQTGIGLNNMRSRATLINAQFHIESEQGNGTKVFLSLKNNLIC